MNKCIVMFSGGLDSRLVVKIMQENFEVLAVYFKLPFSKDIDEEVKLFVKENKIKFRIFDCTKRELFREYIDVIRSPNHGRGSGINPCIDCKIFMLRKTKEFADKEGVKVIATGEVLGQRPMSQTSKSMNIIDEEIGFELMRPLVDAGISGRRREKQISLAKDFKISYPAPAGGCLLCEKLYCEKLKKVLNNKDLDYHDIELLKVGRHFESSQIILGRDSKENNVLEKEKGIKIIPQQPGPTALIKDKKYEEKAKELIQKYSKNKIEGFVVKNV